MGDNASSISILTWPQPDQSWGNSITGRQGGRELVRRYPAASQRPGKPFPGELRHNGISTEERAFAVEALQLGGADRCSRRTGDSRAEPSTPIMKALTTSAFKDMPLPMPGNNSDKDDRGRVLIIAGSEDVPGAVFLCAEAALRAGAGKVQVAVPESLKVGVGISLPETALIALHERSKEESGRSAAEALCAAAKKVDALLSGPGPWMKMLAAS